MRTLGGILECIKDGGELPYDELYYSVLALEALSNFDSRAVQRLADETSKVYTIEFVMEESWNRWKKALGKNPKDWVGWNNDPHNPDYQKMREFHKKLTEKVLNKGFSNE